jgi:DNA topoisomerase I
MKKLVIVESPSKSHTIGKYLGDEYKVVSSKGHIRDLATTGKYGLGVDVSNGFTPKYVPIKGKSNVIKELKKDVKNSSIVYLASDPDREGEAIAWHLKDALGIKEDNYLRVKFNEITHDKVLEAINNPGKIDDNLVKSQETRRILDRIIGFRLSKLLQSKIGVKSAGRVQSVALKLIVDREREIEAFKEEEYWTITANFDNFSADLYKYKDQEIKLNNKDDVDSVLNKIDDNFKCIDVSSVDKKRHSKSVFTTSTLQQEASTKLGFSAKKTMSIAQKLYEGIDIGSEVVGLITYMRTDSVRLSDEFIKSTYAYINDKYGKEYLGYYKKGKDKDNVQDAHEGIRPTSINRSPDVLKKYLTSDEFKLYSLIYKRVLASLMGDAKVKQTTCLFDNNSYIFKTVGSVVVFDGYLKVYRDYEEENQEEIPEIVTDKIYKSNEIIPEQHFTKPPARYSEAKLIKTLEEDGIGRPSTYATIIDTIKSRGYVDLVKKVFIPTSDGILATDKLQEAFSDIINVEYTKNMEDDLDSVATGDAVWNKVLEDFYNLFEDRITSAFTTMEKKKAEEVGELCPNCSSPLVKRHGKYGDFIACSNYPTCKYIKKEEKEVVEKKPILVCPNCGGNIIEKTTRRGKIFYGCDNFPKCKVATWDLPVRVEGKKLIVKDKNGEEKVLDI